MTRKTQEEDATGVASPETAVSSADPSVPSVQGIKGVGWERRRLLIGVAASVSVHLLFVGWTAFDWGTRGVGIGESAQSDASSSGAVMVSLTRRSALPAKSAKAAAKATEPVKVAAVAVKAQPVTHLRPVHPAKQARSAPPTSAKTPAKVASRPVPQPSAPVPPKEAVTTPTATPAVSAPANPSPGAAPTHSRGIAVLTAPQSTIALATPESPRPAAPLPEEDNAPDVHASPEPTSKVLPTARPAAPASTSSLLANSAGVSGASSSEVAAPNALNASNATVPASATLAGVTASGGGAPASGATASDGGQASGGAGRGVPFASAGGGGSVGPDAVRIAYVLDVSGSMKEEGKIDAARQALLQAVGGLRPGDHFTFILFSDRVHPLTTGLISAADTASVKQLEDRFVATVPYGETDLSDALDRALDLPGIQRIFLLSDGGPTLGIVDYDDLADHIRERSHGSVRISTFALGAGEQFEGVRLLRRIAQENNGDYRYVNVALPPK